MKYMIDKKSLAVLGLMFFAQAALAAGGLESEVTSMVTTIRTVIYIIVGGVATIALLWQCAQGFMGRKTWGDVFETMLWIFVSGGSIVLATWAFTTGGRISI